MSTRNLIRADTAGELSLPLMLRRVVAAARDLLGARHAAIANARWFAESEQRRRWLDASSELVPLLLLSAEAGQPHPLITQHAATAAEADFAVLAVPHGADQVIVTGVSGELTAGMLNRIAPLAGSLAGLAILTGEARLVTGSRRDAAAAQLGAATGPLILVPMAAGERVRGALMLGRLATSPDFTETWPSALPVTQP
jgi:hypothetical protein